MFRNYLTTAFRSFWRNKVFSFINILGLAVGISASLVIFLIVYHEFSFESFQKDKDRIYRVVTDMHFPDQEFKNSGVPLPMAPAVTRELTGIELAVPFHLEKMKVAVQAAHNSKPDVYKNQEHIIYATDTYFKLVPYRWLAGSPDVLHNPFAVVLTESRAKSYFPAQDVAKDIGQVITYNDSIKATVAGIIKDLNEATDFTFQEFVSYSTVENTGLRDNWGLTEWGGVSSSDQFLIKLKPGVTPKQIEKQIGEIQKRNGKNAYLEMTYHLQPLADIHFNNDYDNFDQRQAHRPTLYGLLAVAAILLLLGCINFINLTTAHSAVRAKEIGIRKTMGSSKRQLVIQFLSETFVLTLLATILSLVLVPFLLKLFADFIPPEINSHMLWQAPVILFIVALLIVVTLIAGFYPSLVLSKYKPVLVLKNQAFANSGATRKAWLRKSLTIAQFIIAQAFIIAAIIVAKQISFALHKDLGFRKDAILTVATPWRNEHADKRMVLLQMIRSIPEVEKAVLAGASPASSGISMSTMKFNDGKKETETTVEVKQADSSYFTLYNMRLVAGRYTIAGDSTKEYVINEHYARFLGFTNPADAVGKMLGRSGSTTPIVGVLRDFNAHSLHEPVKPLVYNDDKRSFSTVHVLLKPDATGKMWTTAIHKIQQAWKQVYPDEDFIYNFFDDSIAKFYKSEQDTSTLLRWATGHSIFISCLGLFGLAIYTTNQRRKEIGVRKVLGATVTQIITLISKDVVQLVLLSFIIAAPLTWWGMNKWLQNFAFRTDVDWWIFVIAGLLLVIAALSTISFQAIKAATANPVKSLRSE